MFFFVNRDNLRKFVQLQIIDFLLIFEDNYFLQAFFTTYYIIKELQNSNLFLIQ